MDLRSFADLPKTDTVRRRSLQDVHSNLHFLELGRKNYRFNLFFAKKRKKSKKLSKKVLTN